MKIFINDQLIEFELTGEKNVEEIVQSLHTLAQKEEMILSDLYLNGQEMEKIQNLEPYTIESLEELRVQMHYPLSFAIKTIKEAERNLSPYEKKISEEYITQHFEEILAHLDWLKEIFEKASSTLSLQEAMNPLQLYLKELTIMLFAAKTKKMEWNEKHAKKIIDAIHDTLKRMELRFIIKNTEEIFARQQHHQTQEKTNTIKNLNELLQIMMDSCEEIAINFQVGKHLEALAKIIDITDSIELYEKFITTLAKKEEKIKEKIGQTLLQELKKKLEMIEKASEIKDFVELSDIFEYEMKPTLGKLQEQTTALV